MLPRAGRYSRRLRLVLYRRPATITVILCSVASPGFGTRGGANLGLRERKGL